MRGYFDKLRTGAFAAAILIVVSACQPAQPAAKVSGSDATSLIARWQTQDAECAKVKPYESAPECKQRDATATKLAALNYCNGEHTFSSDVKSVWAPCTAPLAIEALERKWGSFYGDCDGAEYGPARDKACAAADAVTEQLNDQGYCYGEFAESRATEDWLPCKKKPEKLTGIARTIHYLKNDWSVQDTNCTTANDAAFAKKACAIRDNDGVQLTNFGLCLKKADYESTWGDCNGQPSAPAETPNAASNDFEGNSTDLAAAKINMLPLVQDAGFVEKVYSCGLRSAVWYATAKGIFNQRIQTEAARERLTNDERQQLDAYTAQHVGDIALTCPVVAKAPLIAELDQAIRSK